MWCKALVSAPPGLPRSPRSSNAGNQSHTLSVGVFLPAQIYVNAIPDTCGLYTVTRDISGQTIIVHLK